jgi:hypothetical protein
MAWCVDRIAGRMKFISLLSLVYLAFLLATTLHADATVSPYAKWTQGPSTDPGFFPIAVWLQSPRNAEKFHAAGINTYVGFDGNPTDDDLATLKSAGIKLICGQDANSLKHANDPTIIGWMHGDEPDNAQSLPDNKGYGPPILPQKIIDEYNDMVKADPTRPVMLNLGLSVAYNDWFGRGTRTGHAEDYPEYIMGSDIVSFDIYPVAGGPSQIEGELWYVPKGVDHLVEISQGQKLWNDIETSHFNSNDKTTQVRSEVVDVSQGQKVIWNCLECTHISTTDKIATPHQVRAEAWMAIIHGSMGLIYFVHEFTPFKEAALLDNPEMLAAVTALNKQITSLAPVLNSPTVAHGAQVQTDDPKAPVDIMVKSYQGSTYLFATEMRDAKANATFTVPGLKLGSTVTVLDENRTIDVKDTTFSDTFGPWDVHIYQIKD